MTNNLPWQPQGTVYGTLLNFQREHALWVPKMAEAPYKAAPKAPVLYVKTANTFALLDVDTSALAYTSGGTATPATYTKINGLLTFSGFDGAPSELDTTDLDSTAMEYIAGLKDEGKFGFEIKILKTDAGQISVRAARTSGALTGFKLTLPDTSVATFNALVKTFPSSGAVNAVLKGSVDTKISGPVVWS